MLILGVDPGIGGALALYDPSAPHDGKPYRLEVVDMPIVGEGSDKRVDARTLFEWLDPAKRRVDHAWIELVFAMPSQRTIKDATHPGAGERVDMPAARAMKMGETVATARTVIICRYIPFTRVPSGVWRRASCVSDPPRKRGTPKPEPDPEAPSLKERSRLKAIEVFPEYADSLFARKKDENRAEASLIARFGAFRHGLVPPLDPALLV